MKKPLCFCVIVFLSLGLSPAAFAKPKTKKVTTEYIYQVPENLTPDKAREIALTRARAQAIADEFGTFVTQSTSVSVENVNGESTSEFMSVGGSELKGEWLEDTEAPVFEYITDGASLAIKVKIKGIIREIEGTRVPIEVRFMRNDVNPRAITDSFLDGDDLFMQFKSPVAGYLAVYLIDIENHAYCLLPYQAQTEGVFEVKSNKEYILFHPDYSEGIDKSLVDRFELETNKERETNRIITIFSPNKFYKGADSKTAADYPRMLPYEAFKDWLSSVRKRDMDLTIDEKSIIISSK